MVMFLKLSINKFLSNENLMLDVSTNIIIHNEGNEKTRNLLNFI